MLSTLLAFDAKVFLLINNNFHFSFLNENMRAATFLGNGWVAYWLSLVIIYVYNRPKFKDSFFLILLTQLVPGIFDIIVKKLVNRPRPIVALAEQVKKGTVHIDLLGRKLTEHSFPSGHAVTAFSLAVGLAYIFPRRKTLFYLLAFIVAFSRVYVGEHYPLDVIAGAALGWGIAEITLIVYKKSRGIKGFNFEN